jgi:uncharacterized membrane protein YjjP (DUF1212 family)
MKNPTVRWALRAVVAGASAAIVYLQGHDNWDSSLIRGAVVAAVLASLEYLTKLNPNVGVGK